MILFQFAFKMQKPANSWYNEQDLFLLYRMCTITCEPFHNSTNLFFGCIFNILSPTYLH